MTPREKSQILIRLLRGDPKRQLAKEAGVSVTTLDNWCRSAGVPTGGQSRAVDAEEFVRQWQQSETLLEVALALGTSVAGASMRAMNYRKKGVPLKKMKIRRGLDWDRLAKIAEEEADS